MKNSTGNDGVAVEMFKITLVYVYHNFKPKNRIQEV